MAPSQASRPSDDDPLLADVPKREGYRVLPPCAVYGRLGRGGMGTVYLGRHLNLDVDVAIKVLDPKLAESSGFVARFHQEAKAAARVADGNLVRVFDVGFAHGLHYIVLEYVEGETARDRVERKGRLAVAEAVEIALGAARGLAAAHRAGLVHRDVKPENILVSAQGEVKLADLGLAKSVSTENMGMTQSGMTLGTPRYMSPEQWRDSRKVGPAGDVWALGATLWYLLESADPIGGHSALEVMVRTTTEPFPATARADTPAALREILARCTHPTPSERYASGAELAAALAAFQRDVSITLADPDAGSKVGKTLVSPPPPKHSIELMRTQMLDPPLEPRPRASRVALAKPLLVGTAALFVLGLLWLQFGSTGRESGDEPNAAAELASSERREGSANTANPTRVPGEGEPVTDAQHASVDKSAELPEESLVPPSPVLPLPTLQLDLVLDADRRWFTADSGLQLEGSVSNARSDRVELRYRGKATPYLIAKGRFSVPLVLTSDSTHPIELTVEGAEPLRFEVVQDSRAPRLALLEPLADRLATKEPSFDLRVRVEEGNLARLVCGSRPLAELEPGVWGGTGFALLAEGENRFEIAATDRSNLAGKLELVVIRDTRPPALLSSRPQAGSAVERSADVAFELLFDEPILRASVEGRTLDVDGSTARGSMRAPDSGGSWRTRIDASDRARNDTTLELLLDVGLPVRAPDGFEVVDAAPPEGARAQPAGPARKAGWAWRVRDARTGMTFLLVEPGAFRMGSPESEEGGGSDETPVHDVRLTNAFYLGETEVTQEQWERVLGKNPSRFPGSDRPVERVSWDDAQFFLKTASELQSIDPERTDRYRLPTEAEWEYACRAETKDAFATGTTLSTEQANCDGRKAYGNAKKGPYREQTIPVGTLPPNLWGFADMHGNVWEWCADAYDPSFYAESSVENPFNDSGDTRVLRGGAWYDGPAGCRAANREHGAPTEQDKGGGFRVARSLP